jgi:hypothetical protein
MEALLLKKGHKIKYIKDRVWKYYYFLTKILNKVSRKAFSINNRYQISTEELKNKLGKIEINGKRKWAYHLIRKELKEEGIISFTNYFNPELNKKSAFYKVQDEWLVKGWHQIEGITFTDHFTKRLEKTEEYTGVYAQIRRAMFNITIDFEEAVEFAKHALATGIVLRPKRKMYKKGIFRQMNSEIYSVWMQIIHDIQDGNYFFEVNLNTTGRVYNTLTSVPRELRQFLRINGKKFIEIDISNCQPLIFCVMLEKWANDNGLLQAADVIKYRQLCEAGTFYKYLIKLMEENGETVNEDMFKVDFFSRVFFSSEKREYKWRKIFAHDFPNVSQCITDFKKDGYNKLAIKLQKTESDIMILDACARLYSGDGNSEKAISELFPIHDAIFTTGDYKDTVESVIYDAFGRYGLKPKIK